MSYSRLLSYLLSGLHYHLHNENGELEHVVVANEHNQFKIYGAK
jgi:hypothetical protein